ncbi:MAG: hypothetical protein ACXACB_03220 [Promethearchaeota archaeon]|jgi:hypothetical protein
MKNKKTIVKIGIVILILSAGCVSEKSKTITPSTTIPSLPSVPTEYKAWYTGRDSWLNQKIIDWKPSKYSAMEFGAYHLSASADMFYKSGLDADLGFVEVYDEVGADVVGVAVFPYHTYSESDLERYDSIVSEIRGRGMSLMLIHFFSGGKVSSFNEFKSIELNSITNFMQRFNPEYYVFVDEPTSRLNEAGLSRSSITSNMWAEHAMEASTVIKDINSSTKTVFAVHKGELGLVDSLVEVDELDIIGFNVYDVDGIYGEYSGWVGEGDVIGRKIDFVNSRGKGTWITEMWFTLQYDRSGGELKRTPGFHYPWRAPLDAKWMRAITYYAQMHNMDGVVPFFTDKFVFYPMREDILSQFDESFPAMQYVLDRNERTEVFYSYVEVIRELKENVE